MTLLSDACIREAVKSGRLYMSGNGNIGPASVDVHLADGFLSRRSDGTPNDPDHPPTLTKTSGAMLLPPGGFVLGSTEEVVGLPADIAARIEGCSTLGRLGLACHVTAGFIDPGFQGTITLELKNMGHQPFTLRPGMRIAQVCFFEMTSPAERPYGSPGVGRYMHQRGATPARPELP